MKRKLFSMLLSAFALLLLMGAAEVPEQAELILAQEESVAVVDEQMLETDIQLEVNDVSAEGEEKPEATDETQQTAEEPAVLFDELVLIDGQPAPIEIGRIQSEGTTYVSLAAMAKALDESAAAAWDGSTGTVTVTTANLTMTARLGDHYVIANGRYLYVAECVGQSNGTVMVPMSVVTKAFDAKLNWDAASGKIHVQRGSGALAHGDAFYNQEDLFWLSRVIFAESGNEPLEGQVAVGNVVLNRTACDQYPDTIKGVIFDKKYGVQFTPSTNGAIYKTPSEESVMAAKLVLEGARTVPENTLYFIATKVSDSHWIKRACQLITTIGGHGFFADK